MIDMQLLTKLKNIIANQAGEETTDSYDLPNDTAENTAIEITNTKRLKLDSIWLDFNTLVQNVTIKVYHKIDGTNYRQYDEFSWATTEEDGIFLSDITINNDWKLTITSTIAQGSIVAIPYNVIKTTMEA
jgi:stress response protein SCP2